MLRTFLEQLYNLAREVDSRFMSDAFLAALGFFLISTLVLLVAQHNFNRPFHRGAIRGSTPYFIVGATGLATVLVVFAWLFADVIFSIGLIDWYTAIFTVLIATPPFMLMTWHSSKILMGEENITFHSSLHSTDVATISFSDITHVEIGNTHITIKSAGEEATTVQRLDKFTYGQMKDLKELLTDKLDPSTFATIKQNG